MDKNTNCDPCEEQGNTTKGKSWCPNCEEKLCNGCASHHRSSKATKSHKLLDLLTELPFSLSTNNFCDQHCNIQIEYFCTHHDVILCRACLADGHRSCNAVVVLDIASAGSKTTVLKETDRETKHIIETLVGFENGIDNNRLSLDKDCSQIENEIALEKSKAIGRLNELEKSLKTKLHRLKDMNEIIMTDELGKIKAINSQEKKRLKQIQLVEKHGTDRQAFLLAYELRKILPETEKSITELLITNKTIQLHFKSNKGIEPSISTLGEITETRKENGTLYYCQLKQHQAQLHVVKETKPMANFQKLDFAVADGSQPSTPTVSMPIERIQNTLQDLIVEKPARNEDIFDWIEANFDDITTKDKKFIRDLMTAVCSSAITGRGNSARVDPSRITQRGVILQKYLDHQAELELQALYALQALVHKLEHPPGVLRTLFDTLYDEDIISDDAFNKWETSKDPAEQEGKGVAMKQLAQFFTWLREADDEVDS